MSGPSTAREALIVETLGEVAALIDRVQALAPALDASRLALVSASAELSGQVTAFESRVTASTENAKLQAVKYIARRTDELARNSRDTQTRAMEEAGRALFRSEMGPTLKRLVMPLKHLADSSAHPWEHWLTHAATAALASALTWALALHLWAR